MARLLLCKLRSCCGEDMRQLYLLAKVVCVCPCSAMRTFSKLRHKPEQGRLP